MTFLHVIKHKRVILVARRGRIECEASYDEFFFQAEDLIDDLLSLESSSLASDGFKTSDNSLQGNDINIKNEPFVLSDAELHALAKDRQKKDNHNMSK
jgi:hypothetical protein